MKTLAIIFLAASLGTGCKKCEEVKPAQRPDINHSIKPSAKDSIERQLKWISKN